MMMKHFQINTALPGLHVSINKLMLYSSLQDATALYMYIYVVFVTIYIKQGDPYKKCCT